MNTEKTSDAGNEHFSDYIEHNNYYVDKTSFLSPLFYDGRVSMFTRPRRFGKTLTLSMIHEFFNLDFKNPGDTSRQERLFKGLDVMKDTEFVQKYMGQFPVVFMSLKSIQGLDFEDALAKFASVMALKAREYSFLLQSPKLDEYEKRELELVMDEDALLEPKHHYKILRFPWFISRILQEHFGRRVILLIDEFDMPLIYASMNGYHDEMVMPFTHFYDILKAEGGNDPIYKIILTGRFFVEKNSCLISGMNFIPETVLRYSPHFWSLFGFTEEETRRYLDEFNLSEYYDLVKENYKGYHFYYDEEIYNPWDICNFVNDAIRFKREGKLKDLRPESYWVGNSCEGDGDIKKYVSCLCRNDTRTLQDLMDGKEVTITLNASQSLDCCLDENKLTDVWTVLVFSGYLTAVERTHWDNYKIRIPNKELRKCFKDILKEVFYETLTKDDLNKKILRYLSSGEDIEALRLIAKMLRFFVSTNERASNDSSEKFYDEFTTAFLSSFGNELDDLKVEHEDDLTNISFSYEYGEQALIIGLKAASNFEEANNYTNTALERISENGRAREFIDEMKIPNVTVVGIAFYERSCLVMTRKLK